MTEMGMTESEALLRIKDMEYECMNSTIHYYTDKDIPMLRLSEKALEEIQQYRAIGTVEELQKLKILFGNENVEISELTTKILKEYPEYLSTGTIEEFKALKEKEERFDRNIRMFNEIGLEIRAKAIDEFADRLAKYLNVESATKYGNKDAEQQRNSYDTLMKYEIADAIDDIAEQMKAGGIDG